MVLKLFAFAAAALFFGCTSVDWNANPKDENYNGNGQQDGYSSPSEGDDDDSSSSEESYYSVVSNAWGTASGSGSTISILEKNYGSATVSGNHSNSSGWATLTIQESAMISQLKTATRISFKVKGDGKSYAIQIPTTDINASDGGFYATGFTATSVEQTVTVTISNLNQPSWAKSFALDRNKIMGIFWTSSGSAGAFGPYTISDIRIY